MENDNDDFSKLEHRIRNISEWLSKTAPECFEQQRHLDSGTTERVYWHYGYMVAVKDVLRLMRGEDLGTIGSGPNNIN